MMHARTGLALALVSTVSTLLAAPVSAQSAALPDDVARLGHVTLMRQPGHGSGSDFSRLASPVRVERSRDVNGEVRRFNSRGTESGIEGGAARFTLQPPGAGNLADVLGRETLGQGAQAPDASVDGHYRPDPAVRRKLADIMAKAAAKDGPRQEADMRRLVLSGEAVRQYEKIAPSIGYRANDAIDGLAFYLLAQWGVANDYRAMFSPAQAAGVRRQAANAFASVAAQVNTDALRQEFGEMLMIQGAIMAGVHEAAVRAGDEAAVARYAAQAREGGKPLFTVDPTTIALTDDGFRQK